MRICLKNLMLAEISAKNHPTVGKRGSLSMAHYLLYIPLGMGSD